MLIPASNTKGDPVMGDLIKSPFTDIIKTVEILDREGVTPHDFETLRKSSSWSQGVIGRIHRTDSYLWAMLSMEQTAKKAGFTEADFRRLSANEDKLREMLTSLRGKEVEFTGPVIDCDAKPFVPEGWKVKSHKKGGQLVWDRSKVRFHLSPNQQNSKFIVGHKLRKELANQLVMNANVLDYLLANLHLIPEEWKVDEQGRTRYIFFWGTIYRDPDGDLYVRYLCWGGDRWRWDWYWLDDEFGDRCPALLAS